MGNNQSQITEGDDGVPRYNYHESVLRDAQIESLGTHLAHADVYNDDEYHSAEENDSDDTSTDNSQDNEDNIGDGRSEPHEQQHSMLQINSRMPVAEEPSLTSSPADLHPEQPLSDYRSGRLNRNEHLNRMLKGRKARSSSRIRDNDSNLEPRIDPSPGNRKAPADEDLGTNISNSCQVTAVSPSCVTQNAPAEIHESGLCLGKRKMLPDVPLETDLPRKKTLVRNSSKRKWLGLSSSSESEVSETEEEISRKSYKKRRMTAHSPKKSRRFDRDSRASDSDERRYGKQTCRQQSRHCCSCKSARDDDKECNHSYVRKRRSQRNDISNNSKRRRQYNDDDDDESSDFSDRTSRYEKRHKCKRHEINENRDDKKRDKMEYSRGYRNLSKNNDENNSDVDIACSKGCQTKVSLPLLGDGQNITAANSQTGTVSSAAVDSNVLSTPCHTFKMGRLSFRNSFGKVFPLKPADMKDAAGVQISDVWGNLAAISDNQKSPVISTSKHSATSHSLSLGNNQMLPTEKESPNDTYVRTDKGTETSHVQTDSSSQHSLQTNLQESPFKNVVLTPSMSDSNWASLPQQLTMHKNLAGDTDDNNSSDMEVEQSDIAVNKSAQFAHSQFLTASGVKSSYLKKNTAARFRHFWSEKKKNIGRNLKSLFSRRNLALEKQPSSPLWQTFSATSALKNSLAESPSSFFRSPSVTSPQMSQVTREKLNGNLLSFSTPPGQCHVTPHLTDVIREAFTSAERYLQQTLLPMNHSMEWQPPSGQHQVLNCRLAGVINMSVSSGDLTDQKTAGIVNWTDGALTHSITSCSRAVAAKAGPVMQAACNDYIGTQGRSLEAPDVVMTPAGGRFDSSVQAILHVVEPARCDEEEDDGSRALMEVFANCFRFARTRMGLHSISCPLVGDGIFPFVICVQSFLEAVLVFLSEHLSKSDELFHIHLIIGDMTAAKMAADFIKSYLECVFRGHSHDHAKSVLIRRKQQLRTMDVSSRTRLHREECPPAHQFTVERTDSGRPRLKRPRL